MTLKYYELEDKVFRATIKALKDKYPNLKEILDTLSKDDLKVVKQMLRNYY